MKAVTRYLVAPAAVGLLAGAANAQDKVVCHIDNADAQATKGLRNIRNHLDVAPCGVVRIGQLQAREYFAYIKP